MKWTWSNQNWHLVTCIFLCLDALYYFISSSTWDTNCSSDCLLWFWLWNSKALKQMKLFDRIGSTNSYWQFIHAQLFKSCSWPHVSFSTEYIWYLPGWMRLALLNSTLSWLNAACKENKFAYSIMELLMNTMRIHNVRWGY